MDPVSHVSYWVVDTQPKTFDGYNVSEMKHVV